MSTPTPLFIVRESKRLGEHLAYFTTMDKALAFIQTKCPDVKVAELAWTNNHGKIIFNDPHIGYAILIQELDPQPKE